MDNMRDAVHVALSCSSCVHAALSGIGHELFCCTKTTTITVLQLKSCMSLGRWRHYTKPRLFTIPLVIGLDHGLELTPNLESFVVESEDVYSAVSKSRRELAVRLSSL